MDVFIIVLVVVIVLGITIYAYSQLSGDAAEEKNAVEINRLRLQKEKDEQYSIAVNELESKYGKITIKIPLAEGDAIAGCALFFEDSSTAVVSGTPIEFRKILAYTLTDQQETIMTTRGNANTNTSTGSMAGRALVGGVLLGGMGALAGATTAKKDTTINTTTSHTTTHDYIIYLNIDDIANPQKVLKFGSDAESANKAAGVFNIIINRNNQIS